MGIRSVKIIEGEPFDWGETSKCHDRIAESLEQGEVDWRAAFFADPGTTKCPSCDASYWYEGELVECLDCGTQWRVRG
jgi:hypothetical protein